MEALAEINIDKEVYPKKQWKNLDDYFTNIIEDPWYKVIIELENEITNSTVNFYKSKNIKTIHLPVTTGSISSPMGLGSDSMPVKVNLCGADTYLADSMQFLLEYGCRFIDNGCYYLMPSFRGENADSRHLCQFYHSEAEIPGRLDDVINLVEEYIVYLCKNILKHSKEFIFSVTKDLSHIENLINLNGKFPRIKYKDAEKLLMKNYPKEDLFSNIEGTNLKAINSKGEKKLIDMFGGIVWVTNFEHISVPFYQAFDEQEPLAALNADLLFGIGEVVGCGERHKTFDEVKTSLDLHKVDINEYEWYCNMKDMYPLKTSGFGMGVERFILWLLKHDDIRDCQVVPRYNGINILP